MAGGESADFQIVPTRDSSIFRLRVRLPSSEDAPPDRCLRSSTDVAGCRCHVFYWHARPRPNIFQFAIAPIPEGAAKVSTHMVLLDKAGSPVPSIGTGESATGSFVGGYVLIAMRDDIKANCVVDNYFVVLCSVHIDYSPATPSASSMENEQQDLGHNLAMMWGKQELTDVSFDVGGESLSAHRLVLAAQSAVFKAELYGPMSESKMSSITIKDMEASTFRSMLHYIYHGSLPDAAKTVVSSTMAEYQRLLVAADRYGVEGLKKICEDTLCADGLTVDSVVSLLELAENHLCSKLKARCFDLLTEGDNFKVVATSADYLHLMQSFPNLLVEFRDRFKIPHEKPTINEFGSHKKTRLC